MTLGVVYKSLQRPSCIGCYLPISWGRMEEACGREERRLMALRSRRSLVGEKKKKKALVTKKPMAEKKLAKRSPPTEEKAAA